MPVALDRGEFPLLLVAELHDNGIPGMERLDQHRTRVFQVDFGIVTTGRTAAVQSPLAKLVDVLEVMVTHNEDPLARVALLHRVATLHEQMIGNAHAAFDAYASTLEKIAASNGGRYVGVATTMAIEDVIFGALVRARGVV